MNVLVCDLLNISGLLHVPKNRAFFFHNYQVFMMSHVGILKTQT